MSDLDDFMDKKPLTRLQPNMFHQTSPTTINVNTGTNVINLGSGHKVSKPKNHMTDERCYHKHPALALPNSDKVIYGGSCASPVVLDADVYIGFDAYSMRWTERHYPWKKGTEVLFKISDSKAPDKPEEFAKLVSWTKQQLDVGAKVHAGCIGGHGRTGTFLAALVSLYGEKDAITYVRKNYCDKAVETGEQVEFLAKHFGITKVGHSKYHQPHKQPKVTKMTEPHQPGTETLHAMQSHNSIWDCKHPV